MEDRVTRSQPRPGFALIALLSLVVITLAWWAIALWPTAGAEPEWLSRTRAACFGSEPGGLPNAGGWLVLVGEPLGMLALLLAVWGRSLGEDLRLLLVPGRWRALGGLFVLLVAIGAATLGARVVSAKSWASPPNGEGGAITTRLDIAIPVFTLTDQHGRRVALTDARRRPMLVTFAFGHCTTVCPTIVRDVAAARHASGRSDVRLVVVTLDPWRDTPERLPSIAARWPLRLDDLILSGSVAEVEAALNALGIGRRRNTTTGDIEHGGTVLLLDDRGKIAWRVDGDWSSVRTLLARH